MHHHVVRHGELSVFYLGGNLGAAECEELRVAVEAESEQGMRRFVFNFHEVRHLDSNGLGILVGIQHRIESLDGTVLFTRVSDTVRAVFGVSHLDRVLHVVDDSALSGDAAAEPPSEPLGALRAQIEDVWRRLQSGEHSPQESLPAEFADYLSQVDLHCRRLLEANQMLRDLVAQGDIDLQHSEARYRSLFENAGDAVLVVEAESGEIIQVNRRAVDLIGRPEADLVDTPLTAVLPDLAGLELPALMEALRQQASQPAEASLHLLRGDGAAVPVHVTTSAASPLGQSLILVHLHDVSVFQAAERRLRTQVFQLSSLNAVERRLASTLDRSEILREVLGQAHGLLEASESVLLGLNPERDRIESVWTAESDPARAGETLLSHREIAKGMGCLTLFLRSPVTSSIDPQVLSTLAADEIIPRPWPRLERTWVTLLISQQGRPAALLILARDQARPWEHGDLTLLHNLGTQVGLSLTNAAQVQEIRRAHSEYRQLFESSRDAIGVLDLATGRIVNANHQWTVLTRQREDQVAGSLFLTAVCEADWPRLYEQLRRLLEEGQGRWECRLAADGENQPLWVQVRASLVQTAPVALALIILIDVTERRRRDQEIKSLSLITTSNPNLVLKVDEQGHVLYANPGVGAFLRRAGQSPEALTRVLPADVTARLHRVLAGTERVETFEHVVADRTILFTMTSSPEERAAILHGVEITAQKRLEQAIAESEANYRALVEGALDGICALRDGQFHTVNGRLCEILGHSAEELVGAALRDHVVAEDWPHLLEGLHECTHLGDCHIVTAFRVRDAAGQEHDIRAAFVPAHVGPVRQILGYLSDVTEQRRLEAQLEQMQRIESIGALAGGIAHDFNNILCGILGHLSLLLARLDPAGDAHRHAQIVEQAAERGADLTRQLLTFARRGRIKPEVVDLAAATDECIELLRRTLGTDVTVEMVSCPTLAPVEVDRAQLRQILVNLAVNAREAMPSGGRLRLKVSSVVLGDPELRRMPQAKSGPHICLEVTDSGRGIPPENLPHIFEPFFSTKPEAKGTGLGLSVVYGMVTHQGGFLDVSSELDHGATFRIFLPRSDKLPTAQDRPKTEIKTPGGTVLVIDDEDLVRDLTREILADAGYRVLTAPNGADGLDRFHEAMGEIAAVVLDIVMPVMNGPETFRCLRQEQPNLPILLASGFASEEETRELLSQGHSDFLPKPFRRDALLEKLGSLIAK